MADPLNPRAAALAAGAAAVGMAEHGPGAPGTRTQARIRAESAQAIATGLVYVGDRLEDIRRELWNANNAKGVYRDRAGE